MLWVIHCLLDMTIITLYNIAHLLLSHALSFMPITAGEAHDSTSAKLHTIGRALNMMIHAFNNIR